MLGVTLMDVRATLREAGASAPADEETPDSSDAKKDDAGAEPDSDKNEAAKDPADTDAPAHQPAYERPAGTPEERIPLTYQTSS